MSRTPVATGTSAASTARWGWHERRRATLWWMFGVGAYTALICAFFPALEGAAELDELMDSMPEGMLALFGMADGVDLSSASGYLETRLFLFGAVMLLVLGIGAGAGVIGRDEESGRLEWLMALPVSRQTFSLTRALVVVAQLVAVSATLWLATSVGSVAVDMALDQGRVLTQALAIGLLGFGFGGVAFAISAGTGRRDLAVGITSSIAGATYLLNGLAPLVGWMEPFVYLSPFWHATADQPLTAGIPPWRLGALLGLGVVGMAAGVAGFARRDVR